MNTFLPLLFSLILLSCGSHKENKKPENKVETTATSKENILHQKTTALALQEPSDMPVGEINKYDLMAAPHADWYNRNFKNYVPNPETMQVIKTNLPEYEVKIFMGTWCPDSKREVPKFYKILELADYNLDKVSMYGMDWQKTTPNNLQEDYHIKRVPTIILYQNGAEVNRFVEYPQETLEQDIAKIVSGEGYQHSYLN